MLEWLWSTHCESVHHCVHASAPRFFLRSLAQYKFYLYLYFCTHGFTRCIKHYTLNFHNAFLVLFFTKNAQTELHLKADDQQSNTN